MADNDSTDAACVPDSTSNVAGSERPATAPAPIPACEVAEGLTDVHGRLQTLEALFDAIRKMSDESSTVAQLASLGREQAFELSNDVDVQRERAEQGRWQRWFY